MTRGLLRYRLSVRHTAALIGAGLLVTVPSAVRAQDIDLADLGTTHPGFRIEGIEASDRAGFSVSGAGDVNGDGLADVIVGAPLGGFAGASYVVFGRADNMTVDLAALGTGGFRIDGIDLNDQSGFSVSGAGDVNGDGLADLIVGAFGANPGGNTQAGESYVVFGKATSTPVDLSVLGNGGFRIDGIAELDQSGSSVSGAGDVNGDGLADLIIGAYSATPGDDDDAGQSYVIFGKATGTTVDLSALGGDGFSIDGAGMFNLSGYSVSGAGDVNGDGLADLIVGAPLAGPGFGSFTGEAFVIFGKATDTTVDLAALGSGGFRIAGIDMEDELGGRVSAAGDVNGDGLSDLIVGAQYANNQTGESFVVFGKASDTTVDLASLGTGGFRLDGIDGGDRSGRGVSGAGDINGDGLADLIIGAYYANNGIGESYVVFGKATNTPVDLSALGNGGFRIDGADTSTFSGFSVSGAGDVNGDGLADLIVGASGTVFGGDSFAGESYVVFSQSTAPSSATYRAMALTGDAPNTAVGVSGDGSNDDTPDSRCWIDFPDGSAASMQTVTLTRSNSGITGDLVGDTADVLWEIATDRTDWTSAAVTFRYTDAEIAGLTEANLTLYRADSLAGSWTELTTTVDVARNTVSATVSSFNHFAIGGTSGLTGELDAFVIK